MAQQAAKVQNIAGLVANGGDHAHSGGLAVDHADGGFVCNQTADDLGGGIAGDNHHVNANGADGGHGFQLFQRQAAAFGCLDHAVILRYRDECAGQAAHMVGCHYAALFHGIVQHGKAGGGAAAAAAFQTHFFQNVGNTIANSRGRRQGQINDARGHTQLFAGQVGHQLAQTGDLERRALDKLCHLIHRGILGQLGQSGAHRTGAGNADMDLAVRLSRAVESTGHKRVIFGCIAENHQFGIAHAHVIFGQLGGLAHHAAHQANGVHIDAGFGGTDVDAGADQVGFGQCTGNAFDQTHIAGGKTLMHQSTVTANKVDADRLGSGIQRFGKPHGVGVRCSAQQHGDGRYADALVDNRNAIVRADLVDNGNQVPRQTGDFVIDFLTGFFAIGINAVQQADAHGNGTHIKVFCGQHLDGFQDIAAVQNFHRVPPYTLCIASKTSCRVTVTCIPISWPNVSKRARISAGSLAQAEISTSIIMQNISCRILWVISSMLMFSSAHTALTRATTPTVSWPITVITAFMTGTPLYYQNHVYYSR